jgi:hypothetical protein
MKRALWLAFFVLLIGLPICTARAELAIENWTAKVDLEFRDTPVMDAIAEVLTGTNTLVVPHDVPRELRVTLRLRNTEREEALRLLCDAAGLDYSRVDYLPANKVILSFGRRGVVAPALLTAIPDITGNRVVVVGAVSAPGVFQMKQDWRVSDAISAAGGLTGRPELTRATLVKADRRIIPLDVENVLRAEDSAENMRLDPGDVLSIQALLTGPPRAAGLVQVPILGAATVTGATARLELARSHLMGRCASFTGDDRLTDLEVKDVPLRDALAQVSKAADIPIHVHESVPREIKVTATIYRMPVGDLLCLIVGQANLTYTVGRFPFLTSTAVVPRKGAAVQKGTAVHTVQIISVVPKSELRVSGPGIPTAEARQGPGVAVVGRPTGLLEQAWIGKAVTASTLSDMECPKCHRKVLRVPEDWRFCPYCGAQRPPAKSATGAKSK